MYSTNSNYFKTHDRYLFQGQEMDDEVKGDGNSVNFSFRMHDPRLGRFFAIDPLVAKYPYYTPYSFSGNKVLVFIELEGKEESTTTNCSQVLEGFPNSWISPNPKGFLLIYSGNTINVFNQETGEPTKLASNWESEDMQTLNDYTNKCNLSNTNFDMIVASSLNKMISTLDAYQTQLNVDKLKMIIYIAHGNQDGIFFNSCTPNPENPNAGCNEILSKQLSIASFNSTSEYSNEAKMFSKMVSTIDDGGVLLIISCRISEQTDDYIKQILLNPKVDNITVYASKDRTQSSPDIFNNLPLTARNKPENGWVKYTKSLIPFYNPQTNSISLIPVVNTENISNSISVNGQGQISTGKINQN